MGASAAPTRDAGARRVLSTIYTDGDEAWNRGVEVQAYRGGSIVKHVLSVAWRARRFDALIVLGSVGFKDRYRDLIIAVLVRRITNPRCRLVISDCTWSAGSAALAAGEGVGSRLVVAAQRWLVRLLSGSRTLFCVLSSVERERFRRHWAVGSSDVAVTPFCHTLFHPEELTVERGDYVFAGGDSMRDYALLLDAVRGTGIPVRIATRLVLADIPDNVLVRELTHARYLREMASARAVVVPLLDDGYRSAGQQTYLNAMLLQKPTVITDSPGVREIVTDGEDALVVRPTAEAMRSQLDRLWRQVPEEYLDDLGRRAKETVLRKYTPEDYRARLLQLATLSDG